MKAVIAHGGGPTSVINASLAGLIDEARNQPAFTALYGARFGVEGLLSEQWTDLLQQPPELVEAIANTPGSALGSSRRKLSDDDYAKVLDTLRRREIRCFFYTGGNGSMSTAFAIDRLARDARYELQVIGIPKTIDNDLCATDHSPGFASTAYFSAIATRDVGEDNRSLPAPVQVLEILGRNAGWIVAATCMARQQEDDAPHLIYCPERRISLDRIAADVERVYRRLGRVVLTVCEGQLDDKGNSFGADMDRAQSGNHRLSSNLGHTLAKLLAEKLGIRARAEKPGLLGRSCGEFATRLDREEARQCGKWAGLAAREGKSGVMVAIQRNSNEPYRASHFLAPLETVARTERLLPMEWIAPEGNDVTKAFIDYLSPLLPPVKGYPSFK